MPRWPLVVILVIVAFLVVPFVVFGIGEEEPFKLEPQSEQVIDELRGTYRGVGIGDSASRVRRVLGPRRFSTNRDPFWPLAAASFAEVGGAMVIRYPGIPSTPRDPDLLRYEHASFLLLDDKVFALMVTEVGAATQAGIAIGDDLDRPEERYNGLNCDEVAIGDFGETFPFCAGGLTPHRHIWFGQDPIRSITITRTGFGGYECPRDRRLDAERLLDLVVHRARRGLGPPRRCP